MFPNGDLVTQPRLRAQRPKTQSLGVGSNGKVIDCKAPAHKRGDPMVPGIHPARWTPLRVCKGLAGQVCGSAGGASFNTRTSETGRPRRAVSTASSWTAAPSFPEGFRPSSGQVPVASRSFASVCVQGGKRGGARLWFQCSWGADRNCLPAPQWPAPDLGFPAPGTARNKCLGFPRPLSVVFCHDSRGCWASSTQTPECLLLAAKLQERVTSE